MKKTVCVALVIGTLAVLLQFTGDNLAEASRRRSGGYTSRRRSSYDSRRRSSYDSRRRSFDSRRRSSGYSGGGMSSTVRIVLIIVGSIVGVVILVMICRCLCRTQETHVVTVNRNPAAQAADPQVVQGYPPPPTWPNKQDVPAYPVAYPNGQMPPALPPVYSAAMETSFTGNPGDAGNNEPPGNPGIPPSYPPPNTTGIPPSYPPPNATGMTVTANIGGVEGGEPASNPYSNAGVTWQSPNVAPPNEAPPPTYGDVYNNPNS